MPRQNYRIDPIPGRGFVVDVAEHGALEVSMSSVIAKKSSASANLAGVISRLKSLIGLAPEKVAVPVQPTKPVVLLLCEDPAALPDLQRIAQGISGRNVKLQAAAPLLLDPGGIANLRQALLCGRIEECMLIAASPAGASPSLSQAMRELGPGYEDTKRVRQAYLGSNGRLRLMADPKDGPKPGLSSSVEPAPDDPREMNDPGPDPGG